MLTETDKAELRKALLDKLREAFKENSMERDVVEGAFLDPDCTTEEAMDYVCDLANQIINRKD